MFKKIINWWNKPWTNGTCITWGLNSMLFSVLFSVIWMFVIGIFKFPSKK